MIREKVTYMYKLPSGEMSMKLSLACNILLGLMDCILSTDF